MSDNVTKLDKPPRPSHSILLAELARQLASIPKLDGLLVTWAAPGLELTEVEFGVRTIGSDALSLFLARRFEHVLMSGHMQQVPTPEDPR